MSQSIPHRAGLGGIKLKPRGISILYISSVPPSLGLAMLPPASIRLSHVYSAFSAISLNPSLSGSILTALSLMLMFTLLFLSGRIRQSSTVSALPVAGYILPPSSCFNTKPKELKKSTNLSKLQLFSTLSANSSSPKYIGSPALSRLHLPFPLASSLRASLAFFSIRRVSILYFAAIQEAARPEAPPPIIISCLFFEWCFVIRFLYGCHMVRIYPI